MAGRVAYTGNIVTNGLVLNLDAGKLDSYPRSGTVWRDISNNQFTGSLLNGLQSTYSTSVSGDFTFDGVDDQVTLGNLSALSLREGGTVETWVYISSTEWAGAVYPNLVSKGASSGWDTDGWSLYVFSPSAGYSIGIGMRDNAEPVNKVSFGGTQWSSFADRWSHIVGTWDGANIRLYRNASQIYTRAQINKPAVNSTSVQLGRLTGAFSGKLSNVKIYDRALSATEVSQNFNALRGRYGI